MRPLPLAGPTEIAQRAGVRKPAVFQWRSRYPNFPQPVAELRTGPVFWWPEVYDWLVLTGRQVDANWTLEQVTPDARAYLPRVAALDEARRGVPRRRSRPKQQEAAALSHGAVLSDAEWACIEPLLPSSQGRRFRDQRQVVEAMVFRHRTRVAWRRLPAQFGDWRTVYERHQRFRRDGTWAKILTRLEGDVSPSDRVDSGS